MKKFEGFDDCIIGWTDSWTGNERVPRLIYSGAAIIASLMRSGMSEDDAFDYFDFNIADAYVGPDTPVISWPTDIMEQEQ